MNIVNRGLNEAAAIARIAELGKMEIMAKLEMGYLLKELKTGCKNWKAFCEAKLPIGVRQADTYIKAFDNAIAEKLVAVEQKKIEVIEPKVVATATVASLASKPKVQSQATIDYLAEVERKELIAAKSAETRRVNAQIAREAEFSNENKIDTYLRDNDLIGTWAYGNYDSDILETPAEDILEVEKLIGKAKAIIAKALEEVEQIGMEVSDLTDVLTPVDDLIDLLEDVR